MAESAALRNLAVCRMENLTPVRVYDVSIRVRSRVEYYDFTIPEKDPRPVEERLAELDRDIKAMENRIKR